MQRLSKSFVRGLLLVLPLLLTGWVLWTVLRVLDGFVPVSVPGLGLVIAVIAITLIGLAAGTPSGKRFFDAVETLVARTAVVKVVYTPVRDFLHAIVGDRKRFEHPIIVDLTPDGSVRALGFVTCDRFDDPQLAGHVAVYLPQSYNFAGNMIVVPRSRVRPVDADPGAFMAFVVSGGVADMPASGTIVTNISAFRSR